MHFALGGVHKNSIQRNVIIDFVGVTGSTPTQSYPNHIPHVEAAVSLCPSTFRSLTSANRRL